MSIAIETPQGDDALTEWVRFHDTVYAERSVRWSAFVPLDLAILTGESPFTRGRRTRPFWAREGGKVVTRVLAVLDERYQAHWGEKLGHALMFEALPGTREAVRRLMDEACEWLAAQGADAVRAGWGMLEFPYVVDAYEALPPPFVRHTPAYYHGLLKDAGFETERGWVDYKIRVRPDLVARWEGSVEAARRAGYALVPFAEVEPRRRAAVFEELWNECFAQHWGYTPFIVEEVELLFHNLEGTGMLESSLFAFEEDRAVGGLWLNPEMSSTAVTAPGRQIRDDERLNFLGIAVRAAARGRGVNLALASCAYLDLVRHGATHLSYTLVLDDNWPSRRTAEKLGADVCANYLVYRRNFGR
jgi:Acetyltransferase (GNAT) family